MQDSSRCLAIASVVGASLSMLSEQAVGQPSITNEHQKLLAADGAAEDYFGDSVSVSGDVAVVGAYQDDDNGPNSGSAYVYRHDGTSWVEEQKLLASDGASSDFFGRSVSVSGDVAMVGAIWDDDKGAFSGSAYVYRHDGTSWVEEQKLLASDGAPLDLFGTSVSVSGDVAVVGAIWDDDNGMDCGSAYVYRRDGTSWIEERKLVASDGAAGDRFGWKVSVAGGVILVGADQDGSGSAYVYRRNGTSWVEEQKLVASDGAAGDRFGWSVSVSGDVAVIGARYAGAALTGSAYMYRHDGATWVQEQKLLASDVEAFDFFGSSVSVSGEVAVIGAPYGTDSGSAYVYRHDGTSWVEKQRLLPSDGAAGDLFGEPVSVSNEVVVVGTSRDDDNGSDSGSAYVFLVSPPGPIELILELVEDVLSLDLQQGVQNSLLAKPETALQKLEDSNENNDVAAINALEAFINTVEAQSGNHIPEADADDLIAMAQAAIDLLSGE